MKTTAERGTIEIRPGTEKDIPVVLDFIRLLAQYEKLAVKTTKADLRKVLFSDCPAVFSLLALRDGEPAAYAIYYFTFSSMEGKRSLWLEDLFVKPEYRQSGIGQALMSYVARIAIENDCGRCEWIVLDWNTTAQGFYKGLGAEIKPDWRIGRLDAAALARMAGT
jgi:GNAT superfamily N-acetyltransferase